MPKQSKVIKKAEEIAPKVIDVQEKYSWYEDTKRWFKHSESILIARSEVATGFVVSLVSMMDWSPLLAIGADTGFTWKQGATLGGMLVAKGFFSEWARRRNASDLDQTITVPGTK